MSGRNEDVFDNWEEIDEVELTSKLNQLKRESNLQSAAPHLNGNQGAVKMMLLNDVDERLSTYGPVEPTVKILKRPTLEQNSRSTTDMKPKAPVKSLRQREHEYAQARLRILGSAKSPEEITDTNTEVLGKTNSSLDNSRKSSYSNGMVGQSTSSDLTQNQRPPDGIIRLPRGPEGGAGFLIRR
ncbi:hypothetical protein HA402_004753 [Bradysia odoriphaga]|nr:hypothetical protein HA402_004753 [Bradysia odoriphaga]